jgi:hypothetical protein
MHSKSRFIFLVDSGDELINDRLNEQVDRMA